MKIVNERQRKVLTEFLSALEIPTMLDVVSPQYIVETALRKTAKGEGIEKLISYLSSCDFYTAPASTRYHGNYDGGLAEHSINVAAILYNKNSSYNLGLSLETIILAGLMHDLCKTNFYVKEFKNAKVYSANGSKMDAGGRFDWQTVEGYGVNDKFPCGHGAKSVIMLQNFIKLTQQEILLIHWHMGPFSSVNEYDFNNAVAFAPEIAAIYTSDFEASMLFEIVKDVTK